ncbi:DUF1800 domain-containing protein [Pedobacter yulinensis]|uniref:DUF1800 domain-containing protein n=1 Tax=Pedobacter yulinensis TaxID=2126353 RepID=A0A2T3HS09_9SPHI|nr:DUF1800 domain-containing protein [Pedobacter yulinensis]PST85209.1 DUF1800 domain-containing protein [Pedobacter yulinensis]
MDRKERFSKIKHLYNRAGFGLSYLETEQLSRRNLAKVVDKLLEGPTIPDEIRIQSAEDNRRLLREQQELNARKDQNEAEKERKKAYLRLRNQKNQELNLAWIDKLIHTGYPLQEKMTLFWHGLFACRSETTYFAQQLNNVQRRYALGNFRTLLIEVARTPAMLQYLNNQQNRKGRPNENFARELMELFTLGRGNYTEQDIKESARAFTGWMYNRDWVFEFNEKVHDTGTKTFFGKTGRFNGEDIIDMILARPEAADFIAEKACRFFVSDQPQPAHIKEAGRRFYESGYDIKALMRHIFTADWFYAPENRGNKIKSPTELLVGLSRTFHARYADPKVLIRLQQNLGQYLFNPPNVAGWPGGRSWIDSSSLMLRMKIPSLVLNDGEIDFSGKADPEEEAVIAVSRAAVPSRGKRKSFVNAEVDWAAFTRDFPKDITPAELAAFLLQVQPAGKVMSMLADNKGLRSTAIEVASLPEYQLC